MINQLDHNVVLRNNVKKLGKMLGEILEYHGGIELFNKVETIREMTKSIRKEFDKETYDKLKEEIHHLEPPKRKQVIRAFSIYFHLINIAEQNHRIRRRRQYQLEDESKQPFSIENAVSKVKSYALTPDMIEEVLNDLSIELIITAHPTEATKRSVLEIQKRISIILDELDNPLATRKELELLDEKLFNEVTTLWQTDELRHRKPQVMDEVRNGLYYFDQTLFDTLPAVHEELEQQFNEYFPDQDWNVPNIIHFGSWIGGDRDGNPNVTPEITWQTLQMQRDLVLSKYEEAVQELMRRFSQSSSRIKVSDELDETIEADEIKYLNTDEKWHIESEIYRRKFAVILKRVRNVGKSSLGYKNAEQFLDDLIQIRDSAETHQPGDKKLKIIRTLIRQVELFGFHLATLDIRNHSGEHEFAVSEMLQAVGITSDYSNLSEEEKVSILTGALRDPRPLLLFEDGYTKETQKVLQVFRMIKKAHAEFGKRSIEVYLISMTQSASDLLEVLLLAKEAGIYRLYSDGHVESDLHVAPLLETIDDLIAGPNIMKTMFEIDVYRNHLAERGNHQEIMLGYSDGSKDGGTLTANWKLFKAQLEIHNMAKQYDIRLKFFHGRGGSLGRGGGSLNTSILSQPVETLGDGVKITEQGEVLSSRYLLKDISYRNLEQAASALLDACAKVSADPVKSHFRQKEWEDAMENISGHSLKKYQSLVFGDKDFLTYFNQATPLRELGALNIGSRPMSRKNSERFEDLRAIPWVFAWTQSRQMIPAWYAAGTGLNTYIEEDATHLGKLQIMYKEWPFFRSTINNLQMALMKADMTTAKEYLNLVDDKQMADRIFKNISDEYNLTRDVLLRITGNEDLLSHTPNIRESVHRRNPYVDPLNFLQVELIRQLREQDEAPDELVTEVLLTINGVAAGLVNTG
ncbi:phosphoenolpyruvate carboxylase [Pseudogracilibacillus auburnensis]|uniref:phosphoenolpyruvate carboxylase n=1 Tax=Pseudogracilibacillus auburnensis TaxID=1494959 RepID=UPI001A95C6C1|nr:phosphoenolpyruvate carboxylase [Pseudogracilibacillus auburnensis]MBO1005312.1 phosphoenolpyruvate carboxylase [Pseudogracilibacillus auburnensis]